MINIIQKQYIVMSGFKKQQFFSLVLLFHLLGFISCNQNQTAEFTDWPIIESYLEPGKPFSVSITRQIPFITDVTFSDDDINNLDIRVSFGDSVIMLQAVENGKYVDTSLIVQTDIQYNISFDFNKKKVTAYTSIPSKPANLTISSTSITVAGVGNGFPGSMPEPLEITWSNSDNSYYMLVIENIETILNPIFENADSTINDSRPRFRKTPTTMSGEMLRPMEFQYYGTHQIILYHVLPDYATLYDNSSSSSQNLTNPSVSIINGYGIFTGLNSDTVFVEVIEQ